jgi:hypothetical protein
MSEHVLDELFDALVGLNDVSFAHFRCVWAVKGLSLLHIVPFLRFKGEGKKQVQQGPDPKEIMEAIAGEVVTGLFRYLTEMLENFRDVHTNMWSVYALYTLYETQVTKTKHKIVIPMALWRKLLELKVLCTAFDCLCISAVYVFMKGLFHRMVNRDPFNVLHLLIMNACSFHLDYTESSNDHDDLRRPSRHRFGLAGSFL